MKVSFIVEGDSDKILLEGQSDWFKSLGLEFEIFPTYGKPNMIKNAKKHYRIAILRNADNIIFLPDQDNDLCALVTRSKIGTDTKEKAVTIVIKRELEAWILADGQCIRNCIGSQYSPAGQTDSLINPKQKLQTILERKYGYTLSEIEAAKNASPYFSINRASNNNTSAKRLKEFIEDIS